MSERQDCAIAVLRDAMRLFGFVRGENAIYMAHAVQKALKVLEGDYDHCLDQMSPVVKSARPSADGKSVIVVLDMNEMKKQKRSIILDSLEFNQEAQHDQP